MAYVFDLGETIREGIRRIAYEEIDKALQALDEPDEAAIEDAVHDTRKRCKKLRALVRLTRPSMGETYTTANRTFRDAARELSSIRDAHALLATFDDLVAGHVDQLPTGGLAGVRRQLSTRAQTASRAVRNDDPRIGRGRDLLRAARDEVDNWPLSDDFAVLAAGAAKTYKRGRNRLSECVTGASDEQWHEARKRVKYSWYHVRLLSQSAPSMLKPLASRLHDLSDALGDDHDLAVLADQLRADPDAFGGDRQVDAALLIINGRRADLQRRAVRLGTRLYVETPRQFSGRLAGYWDAWHTHGKEVEVGEVADLFPPADALDELTMAQLRERAKRIDVPGRSDMTRSDLVAAIRATADVD